ncbi:Cleavage and polyadenylation specificity factor subunit 1, partial [Borealophlyctis nickersoniae]
MHLTPPDDFDSYGTRSHRLAIRFVRVSHSHISRLPKFYSDTEGDKLHPVEEDPHRPTFLKRHYLKPFRKIGTRGGRVYDGVFMTGARPCWIMVAKTGGRGAQLDVLEEGAGKGQELLETPLEVTGKRCLRVHPMIVDGDVKCFAGIHNVNIAHGFVYINHQGQLRICNLLPHFLYDSDWPYCKVPLRRTPQHLTYHEASETYVMSTSTPAPFVLSRARYTAALAAGVIEDGDELPETEEMKRNSWVKDSDREEGMYWPQFSSYALELVSPVTWETVDIIRMEEHEHILAVQAVNLESKQTTTGRKLFLAVGTGYVRGEDLATRGRILVYDIIDVVPEPDNPQTNHKFKQLFVNEEKGPVTALCNVGGYLLAAIGSKIIIHTFEDGESLTGVAFIDVNMYVHSVCAVKNLILVSDISKSVWFLGFQEEPPKLALLGKDYHPLHVYSSEFLIDESMLAFLVGDGDMNLHVMTYAPYNIQSSSGQKLIRRGDFHVGQHVQKLIRLRRMPSQVKKGGEVVDPKQHVCVCATLEGGLSIMIPVSEKLYKRMYGLYSRMVNNLQHPAGLNPRGFR